jgi:hypothetical protein
MSFGQVVMLMVYTMISVPVVLRWSDGLVVLATCGENTVRGRAGEIETSGERRH